MQVKHSNEEYPTGGDTLRLLLSLDKEDVNETLHVRYPDCKSIDFPTFCALVSAQHRVGWHMRQIDGRTSSVTLRLASGGVFHYEEKQAGKVRRQATSAANNASLTYLPNIRPNISRGLWHKQLPRPTSMAAGTLEIGMNKKS